MLLTLHLFSTINAEVHSVSFPLRILWYLDARELVSQVSAAAYVISLQQGLC